MTTPEEPTAVDKSAGEGAAAEAALLPQHQRLLAASRISADVAAARGYRSVTSRAELERLGFGRAARLVPTLLIPVWSCVTGAVSLYHHRPDEPRMRAGGPGRAVKPAKYEFPHDSKMVVDVHPLVREAALDPAVPLVVTEGVRKADAAISAGLCCLALLGVWNWRGTNEYGGKTALPDWERIAFKGRREGRDFARPVYLAFDSDAMLKREVYQALLRAGSFFASKGADVRYVYLPPGERGAKVGLDDYFAAGGTVESLLALASRELREPPDAEEEPPTEEEYVCRDGGLPFISLDDRHLRHKVSGTVEAVAQSNDPPVLFVSAGALARVARDENDRASVQALSVAALRAEVSQRANFGTFLAARQRWKPVDPPPAVIETVHSLGHWPGIPPLAGLVTSPVAVPTGRGPRRAEVLTRPGYHAPSRLFYHAPKGFRLPDTAPTPAAVRSAAALLDDLFADFPFADAASRAHVWALLLLPFVRPLIAGPTPLHVVDAPQGRTGKSLLAEVCTMVFAPDGVGVTTPPATEEEWSKTITSAMLGGASHLLLDNARTLNSPKLLGALTTPTWSDRLLGGNEMASLKNRLVWVATANNLTANDELMGRSVWIRLDAGVEEPGARTGFRHQPIKAYVRRARPALVGAVLTLVRGWLDAGCPAYAGKMALGGFEEWLALMGGLLDHCGVAGFLSNREALRDRVDRDGGAWRGFVEQWWDTHGAAAVSAADLLGLAADWFAERLGDGQERSQRTRLGKLLASHVDRVYAGRKVVTGARVSAGASKGSATYALVPVESDPEAATAPEGETAPGEDGAGQGGDEWEEI